MKEEEEEEDGNRNHMMLDKTHRQTYIEPTIGASKILKCGYPWVKMSIWFIPTSVMDMVGIERRSDIN